MEKQTFCPLYVDYVRECVFHMKSITREIDTTLRFCLSGNYQDCPFFRFISDQSSTCEHFKNCEMCEYFKHKKIEDFVELADRWCLGDFTSCKRYQIKQEGNTPPANLHPEGHEITE